jgi:acyl-ACP thioesterase
MPLHPLLIKTEPFTIRTYEIDNQKKATVPALVKLMHEAAMQNVIDINLSVWDLERHQISWVLMRKQLTINQLPNLGERIKIRTHCAGFEKFFTYRDYKIFNQQDELLAQASSTWLLMDTIKRRMARIPDFILAIETPPESECLPRPKSKLPKFEKTDLQKSFRVGWYDLDFNQHLNNVFYLQWMLETVPDVLLQKGKLQHFDIIYKQECQWKEEIICETQILSETHLLHRLIRKSDGKQLSLAASKWLL